jgi:putative lipase involved disintegration of autophagic bodies
MAVTGKNANISDVMPCGSCQTDWMPCCVKRYVTTPRCSRLQDIHYTKAVGDRGWRLRVSSQMT